LSKHGLSVTGKKEELIERLVEFQAKPLEKAEESKPVETQPTPQTQPQVTPTPASAVEAVVVLPTDEQERKKMRLMRFGGEMSEEEKKRQRAERFGIVSNKVVKTSSGIPIPVETLMKRKEKFGVTSELQRKIEEEERKRKRMERFSVL
jgi:hypothetical protein